MNQRSFARVALVGLPLTAFVLYAALNWFRLEEVPITVGADKAARENSYLGFERLLDRMGNPPRTLHAPKALENLPAAGTLFLAGRRLAYMTPERVRRLVAWTNAGGHLVVEWERAGIDDPLLDALGVERVFPKEKNPFAKKAPESNEYTSNLVTIDWPELGSPLKARAGTRAGELLDQRARAHSREAHQGSRLVALAFDEGEGRVTLLPSLRFLRNDNIGELDHGELGWRLASARAPAILYLRFETAGLGDWLRDDAWPAVLALALAILLWLARIVPRFGPLEADAPPPRRSLLEHIVASGRYLWSRGAGAELLEAVRERAARAARNKGVSTQPIASQAPGAAASRMDDGAFTARVAALQKVEQGLAPRESKKKGRKR